MKGQDLEGSVGGLLRNIPKFFRRDWGNTQKACYVTRSYLGPNSSRVLLNTS